MLLTNITRRVVQPETCFSNVRVSKELKKKKIKINHRTKKTVLNGRIVIISPVRCRGRE